MLTQPLEKCLPCRWMSVGIVPTISIVATHCLSPLFRFSWRTHQDARIRIESETLHVKVFLFE